jgi:subtilisin family serine protease
MGKRARLAFILLFAACGGGGGPAPAALPPGPPPPAPPPARASVSGQVDVFLPVHESVLETEPNDTQPQAHYLGEVKDGHAVTVLGHVRAGAGNDELDGFSLLAPSRVRVSFNLSFDVAASPELFFGVWDFTVQQWVEVFGGQQSPVTGEFHVKGICAIVVVANAAEADYVLAVEARQAGLILEREEDNEFYYAGQFVGEILVGDVANVKGHGNAGNDAFDSVIVVCPTAVDLDVAVGIPLTGFPETAEFDILVYDLTGGEADPPLLDYFVWRESGQDIARGRVPVAAGSLIQIFVYAFTGDATWTVTMRGHAPAPAPARSAVPEVRGAPRASSGGLMPDFGPGPEFVPGEAVVRLAPAAAAPNGCSVLAEVPQTCAKLAFDVPEGLTVEEMRRFTVRAIACLGRCEGVRRAEPNYIRRPLREPDDTFYNLQWHYPLINLPQAWELTTGSQDVTVAVLDTGSTAHPDLAGRHVGGYDFISDPAMAADGNGIDPDPTDPGDRLSPSSSSTFHGTHVAGTIGAETNNGDGVAGVTWAGGIMHLRVLGRGGGTDFDIANAILYAARLANSSGTLPAKRVDVINMSLGGPGFNQTVADAVSAARQAGVVIFAASGNEDSAEPFYPAAYDGVISIGAVGLDGVRAPYSNYGSTLDLVGPGGNLLRDDNADGYVDGVLSTWVDEFHPDPYWYTFYQGTSMACPHAAGVAALMLAVKPDLTPDEIEQMLKSTAYDLGPSGVDPQYGSGLVDAHAAVLAAHQANAPPLPPTLAVSASAVSFNRTETTDRVRITNAGGGMLDVEAPLVFLSAGQTWLQASLVPGTGASSNASAVDLAVDRTGLVDGVYFGRVGITSNGGEAQLQILLTVQSTAPAPPAIEIKVRAVNADTGEVVNEVLVNPASSLEFDLKDLPAGKYRIEAGTDNDGDGVLCEGGELCGAYPGIDYPIVLNLQPGDEVGPFRFTVAPSGLVPTK